MIKEKYDFYSPINLKSYNLDQTMRYQLDMLERLDPITRKHSENVANLSCRICEYLRCSTRFTIHCTIAAFLHDIGKLFIPPEILNKPTKLTDEEYEIMKTHTTLGYEMCMKDLKLRPYALGPLDHHEALNGTGYPNGITKKDIPFYAQIIRVADEYDAIVSKRQYKSHIGISDTYSDFNEFYINKMMDLDNKYESIVNNTSLTIISDSKITKFFRKLKSILSATVELNK